MLTGQIRNEIDALWSQFWMGGITNPLVVIEQISYLVFARMLDMQETKNQRIASRKGETFKGMYPDSPEGQLLRWQNFRELSGKALLPHLKNNVYPHFAKIELKGSDIAQFMADADVEIRNEAVLTAAVGMVDKLPLDKSDVKGDIYEHLLSKLSQAGINGQFRTPRHIIDAMIDMLDVLPTDVICDPACGTAGFLARTMEHLTKTHSSPESIYDDEDGHKVYSGDLLHEYKEHINNNMFWGFDFDNTMLRVSAMNMLLHGVPSANITYQDSLNKSFVDKAQEENFFDKILANPPFTGSLDEKGVNPNVLKVVKSKKTELLFVALILRMLKLGGQSATIVPDGVLFNSSKAHQQLREHLVESNQLEAVISLPSGVFKPYAGVSTAILIFTKGGSSDHVWFYDVQADGFSLDDKRTAIKQDDLPTLIEQFKARDKSEAETDTNDRIISDSKKHFWVSKADIKATKYDLSINRYKQTVYEEEVYEQPKVVLRHLLDLENEILADLKVLEGMLK